MAPMLTQVLTLLGALSALGVNAQSPPAGDLNINQQLYDTFVRITKYAAASYASNCPTPPNGAAVVQYFNNAVTDTQATLFRDDTRKELIIAFRGTSDIQDFISDFSQAQVPLTAVGTDCPACKVHNGTQTGWNSVSADIIASMKSQLSSHPSYKPIVTGHSLGGALASLASASLVSYLPDLTTYTLGQFRTGDPAYAAYIDQILPYPRMYRITHTNDGVPQTIHRTGPAGTYAHHSREHWELEPFGAANTYKCRAGDDAECNDSTFGLGVGGVGTVEGINPAHLCYSGILIGNPVDAGASACNAVSLLPQNCSTATLGGVV